MRDYDATVKNLREAAKGLLFDAMPYRASVMRDAADAIEELLAVVPKRGEWITTRTWEHDGDPYCSNCGFEQPYMRFEKFKFCPNCGARMEVSGDV